MSKRTTIIIGSALVIIALAAWIVKKEFFGKDFSYAGTVEATRIDLPARIATTVQEMLVREGEPIKKDQVLARLSCEDVSLQQKLAQENFDRAMNLQRTGSISKEVFDLNKNKKQEADTRASWCEIKAPVDGTVLTRFLEPAEWVNPGTKLVTVANLSDLWAYFYVPQEVMSNLKVGTDVSGNVPELNRTFSGKIIKINDEAEFTPKNVQTQSERTRLIFGVKVAFQTQEGQLKPGMTIESMLGQSK